MSVNYLVYDSQEIPWQSWEEWKSIYYKLFNNNVTEQLDAVDTIEGVWMARGCCPLVVEITAQLISIRCHLDNREHNNFYSNSFILSKYSFNNSSLKVLERSLILSLIRLVNGLCDRLQTTNYTLPIRHIAVHILKLPEILVDIRHYGTHSTSNELPSLPILINASQLALNWLLENYWKVQFSLIYYDEKLQRHDYFKNFLLDIKKLHNNSSSLNQQTYSEDSINNILKLVSPSVFSEKFIPLLITELIKIPKSDVILNTHNLSLLISHQQSIWKDLLSALRKRFPSFISYLFLGLTRAFYQEMLYISSNDISFNHESEWKFLIIIEWTKILTDKETCSNNELNMVNFSNIFQHFLKLPFNIYIEQFLLICFDICPKTIVWDKYHSLFTFSRKYFKNDALTPFDEIQNTPISNFAHPEEYIKQIRREEAVVSQISNESSWSLSNKDWSGIPLGVMHFDLLLNENNNVETTLFEYVSRQNNCSEQDGGKDLSDEFSENSFNVEEIQKRVIMIK